MIRPAPKDPLAQRARLGFTLLELLVVISLLAILSLALVSGLRLGGRVWERSTNSSERNDDVRIAAEFLRNSLSEAYPLLDRAGSTQRMLKFTGEAKALQFLAPMPRVLERAGLAWISIHLEPGASGTSRILVDVRRELSFPDAELWPSTVLLDKVQDIDLAYFGALERGQAADWHPAWQSAFALPRLVRIRVSFPTGDERAWPDLIVAPYITAESTCSYDPLLQDCRGR